MADGHLNFDTKIDTSGFNAGTAEIKKALSSVSRGLGTMKTSMEKAFSGNQRSVTAFQSKAKALDGTISKLKSELERLGNARFESEDFKFYNQELEKAEEKLSRLYDKRDKQDALGVKEFSKSWENLSYDIEQAENRVNDLKATIQAAKDTGAQFTFGVDTNEYAELARKLREAEAEYDRLKTKGQELNNVTKQFSGFSAKSFSEAFRQALPITEQLKGRLEQIRDAFHRMGSGLSNAIHHPLQTLNQILGSVKNAAQYAGKELLKAFGSGIKRAISGIGNVLKNIATRLKNGIVNAAKNAAKSFSGLKKSTSDVGKGMSGLLKKFSSLGSMLKRMLTRRFLMGVINGAKEGIENLAQASPAFNAAMSSLKGSLTGMKNAFASAFGSILPIVLPVLQTLIGWLTTAANYIAMFFSALSGSKTFKKAVAVQEDYAASLGDTAKAAKEAKNELLGFDKITKLQDDSSSGGGGGGGISPADMFEDAEIDSSISKFVEDLKAAWAAEDFTAVGEIIGNKLNEMVNKVDEMVSWDNVGDKIITWINNIGEVFNSFMDTVDFENIGKTIADGMNTITYSIETFLDAFDLDKIGTALADIANGLNTNIDWDGIGRTIAKGLNEISSAVNNFQDTGNWKDIGSNFASSLNSLIDNVNGEELGKALSAKLRIMLEAANGFVHEFHWADLGSTLSDVVEGWFGNIDWEMWGDTIATGLNGISDTVISFVNDTNWEDIGDKVGSAFSKMIDELDGEKLGKALGDPIQALNETIDGFLKNFEENGTWGDAGIKIGDAINGWFDSIDWKMLGSNISGALAGLMDTLAKALEEIDWFQLAQDTEDFIAGIDWSGMTDKLFEGIGAAFGGLSAYLGKLFYDAWDGVKQYFSQYFDWGDTPGDIIKGLCQGIWDAIKNIGQWIYDHVFKPFIDGFKKAFGINSPSTVMAEMGGYLIDGLKNGLSGIWDKIKEKFTEMLGNIKQWFTDKKADLVKAWDAFKSGIGEVVTTLKAKVEDSFNKAKEAWTALNEKGKELLATLKAKTEEAFTKAKESWNNLSDKGKELLATLKAKTEDAFTKAKAAWEGLSDKAKDLVANLKAKTEEAFTTAKKTWEGLKTETKTLTAELSAKLGTAKETVEKWWGKIKGWFTGSDAYKKDGGGLAVKAKLADTVKDWFLGLWAKFKSWFNKGKGKEKLEVDAKNGTNKDDTKSWWNSIKSWWGDKKLSVTANVDKIKFTGEAAKLMEGNAHWYGTTKPTKGQTGGVITHPTNMIVGENGPEALIPLKNNTQWLDTVSKYVVNHIPHYATGNVIPANFGKYFAVLGDNKKEPEVVSPLSTMKQAVKEALRESGLFNGRDNQTIQLNVNLDGNVIYQDVVRINRQRTRAGGVNPLGV